MTIEQWDQIDGMGIDTGAGELVLFISDHLSWEEAGLHFQALEKKLNSYLDFIHSQQHLEQLGEARDLPVKIMLVHQYEPTPSALAALQGVEAQLEASGFRFQHASLPQGY